jgi:hypothetical protein
VKTSFSNELTDYLVFTIANAWTAKMITTICWKETDVVAGAIACTISTRTARTAGAATRDWARNEWNVGADAS